MSAAPATVRARSRAVPERVLAVAGALLVVFFGTLPLWASGSLMRTLVELFYYMGLAQMWNLLAGFGGMVSIGQQAWVGLGGYTLIVMADDVGLNPFLTLPIAGAVAAAVALPTAALVFRLRGGYFAVGTWVVAEVIKLVVANNTSWLKGGTGRSLLAANAIEIELRQKITFWVAAALGLGVVVFIYALLRSRTGLALAALRDSETAAHATGVNVFRVKLWLFVVVAAGTGMLGALIYLNTLRITPDAGFSVQWTAYAIFIAVIGGLGTIEGPIVGTLVFFVVREYLADFQEWSVIILGGLAVVTMLVLPYGIWGTFARRYGLELFPVRRRLPPARDVASIGSPSVP